MGTLAPCWASRLWLYPSSREGLAAQYSRTELGAGCLPKSLAQLSLQSAEGLCTFQELCAQLWSEAQDVILGLFKFW